MEQVGHIESLSVFLCQFSTQQVENLFAVFCPSISQDFLSDTPADAPIQHDQLGIDGLSDLAARRCDERPDIAKEFVGFGGGEIFNGLTPRIYTSWARFLFPPVSNISELG